MTEPVYLSKLFQKPHIILEEQTQVVDTVTQHREAFDAVKVMADKNIGALLVFEGSELAGMITERDYARKIALMSRSSQETRSAAMALRRAWCSPGGDRHGRPSGSCHVLRRCKLPRR